MSNFIFITVNYGTSSLIESWVSSVRRNCQFAKIIIVDNYISNEERCRVINQCDELGVEVLLSENVGYGRAINLAILHIKKNQLGSKAVVFAGNMDIEYEKIPNSFISGKYAFIPKAYEGNRNRNPFLTHVQKNMLILHRLTILSKSTIVFKFVILMIKLCEFVPSTIWAVHGSLFCFNMECLSNESIFNEDSFLYSEELEFASYMESLSVSFIEADIIYKHNAHVATGDTTKKLKKFIKIWSPSFRNWLKRWS